MEEAKRFATENSSSFIPLGSMKETVKNELLSVLPILRRIPRRIDKIGSTIEKGELSLKVQFFSDKDNAKFIKTFIAQLVLVITGAALGGISVCLVYDNGPLLVGEIKLLSACGYVGITISAVILLRAAIAAVHDIR